MIKKIKSLSKKVLATLVIFGMIIQMFMPVMVYAVEDANKISIEGSKSVTEKTFNYDNGSVTVKLNGNAINETLFGVEQNDVIKIEFSPNENYKAVLKYEDGATATIVNNVFEFSIGNATSNTLKLTPSFTDVNDNSEPPIEALKFDFTINGESFTNVSMGDELIVSEDFNMNAIDELYITKIVNGDIKTYTYANDEFSYDLLDSQGRHIFETSFVKISDNYANLRVITHVEDMLLTDLDKYDKKREDYFGIYITGVKLIKSDFKGVEIATGVMPDNYDFTVWNGVDLVETTVDNPGTVTAYYGEDTISLNSKISNPIKKIELVEDNGVPSSAVEIDNENGTIKVLSNFYNQIPVKVELEDGTIGYITINRIGIFIGDLNKGQNTFYHGAANGNVNGKLNVETDKQRLVAVFYHENTTTYNDYDLVVNITYVDGTTETRKATGVGDIPNTEGLITGSDYILWSGDSIANTLEKVSVTAVKKDALTNETTFGGVTFGSGSGVVWKKK